MQITIELPYKLSMGITEYCKLNGIDDVNGFALSCLINGFNIDMFGSSPADNIDRELSPSRIKTNKKDYENNGTEKEDIGGCTQGEQEGTSQDDCGKEEEACERAEEAKAAVTPKKRKIKVIKK